MNNIDKTIENIGHKIKYYRNLNKVSLSKLAKKANISKSTLFGLEEGHSNPTISTLINISKTLNIKLSELISNNEENDSCAELSPISSTNNVSVYKLALLANQTFVLNEDIYSEINLTVIDGELLQINESKIILENQTTSLRHNAKLKAGAKGTVAILNIKKTSTSNYIDEDIFINKATTSQLLSLSNIAKSCNITRAVCSSIYPVEHPQKIENIQMLELQEKKELHYYFLSTLIGVVGGVSKLLDNLELKPNKQIEEILTFIKKANTQEFLSNIDFQNIPRNPIKSLIEELKKLICEKYTNCNILETASKLSTLECKSSSYILIIDELVDRIEQTQNLLNTTFLINIYRAVELIVSIKEQELTNDELDYYLKIRENLIKALYLAKNSYTNLAIKEINKILNIQVTATSHNAMQLYIEALDLTQNALENIENLETFTTVSTLEQKIDDLNLEKISKINLNPSIGNSGKYIYLLKCK